MLDKDEQLKISFTGLKIFERQEAKVRLWLSLGSTSAVPQPSPQHRILAATRLQRCVHESLAAARA